MAEIIPAILPKSYEELEDKLEIAAGNAPVIQIDVCDGAYVPSRTWPFLKGPGVEDTIFNDIVAQDQALPHWEDVDFEFDLMAKGAYDRIPDFISAGAARVIVHLHSCDGEELSAIVRDYGKKSEEVGMFDVELGLAVMPSDSPESIAPYVDGIHFVQVMGIERIGFQGQEMSPKAPGLVRALKEAYPGLAVSVDGGVNLSTAQELIEAGADRLVVGSALFNEADFIGTLEQFKAL